jgi:hypothetical protein
MKKILLGTSALAAVALTAGSATAEAPTVNFHGDIEYAYVFYDNDQDGAFASRGHDVIGNGWGNALYWDVKGVTDGGLEYSSRIDWRYEANGVDESWIKLGGAWGSIVIGNDDAPSENVLDANSIAAAPYGIDGFYVNNATNFIGNAGTVDFTAGSGDDAKIVYYSPDFNGFNVAASFTPTSANANGLTVGAGNTNSAENGIDLFAGYSGAIGDAGIDLTVGYKHAEIPTAAGAAEIEDLSAWHVGGIVSIADFQFAAGYMDNGDGNIAKGIANADAMSGYNVGVAYSTGALSLSAVYTATEADLDGLGEDELDAFTLAAGYKVADGLKTFAEISRVSTDDADVTGASMENLDLTNAQIFNTGIGIGGE